MRQKLSAWIAVFLFSVRCGNMLRARRFSTRAVVYSLCDRAKKFVNFWYTWQNPSPTLKIGFCSHVTHLEWYSSPIRWILHHDSTRRSSRNMHTEGLWHLKMHVFRHDSCTEDHGRLKWNTTSKGLASPEMMGLKGVNPLSADRFWTLIIERTHR